VRDLVVARVRVVEEAAFFDEQLARVHAREGADVPAAHALSRRPLDRLDREPHLLALLVATELPVVGPAVAVTEHLVVARAQPVAERRVALERDGARADADPDLVLVEETGEPPDAAAAPVLEVRLGSEVAPRRLERRRRVLAPRVVDAVAVEEVVLRTLLVVHDDADGDARAVGPAEVRRMRAV